MVITQKAMKIISIVMLIGLLSKVLGFTRELVVANHFGVSAAMDAFNIANNIPDTLMFGISAAISATFIPVFTQKVEMGGKESALELTRKLMSFICLAGILICAVGMIFSAPFTRLLAPKFTCMQVRLASDLTKILLTTGAFLLLSGLCTGYLQAQEHFIVPAFMSYPLNMTIILIIVLFARDWGIYTLAIAWALGNVVQFLFILPSMLRTGFKFCPSFDFRDPDLMPAARLILPVFAGTILFQVNTIVDRGFASGLAAGTISALNYAAKVNGLIVSVIATNIATIALPTLAQAAATNDMDRIRYTMLQAIRGINFIVVPITIAMVVLRVPLIQFIYQRGVFGDQATALTASALCYLSLGLFAYGLREIFSRVFYALNDTLTPMINTGITIIFNILLLFIFVPRFGMAGLAGATSISGVFSAIQLLIRLRYKMGSVHELKIAVSFLKTLLASLVMGLMMSRLYPLIRSINPGMGFMPQLFTLLVTAVGCSPFYLIALFLLKAEEIAIITDTIKQKLPKTLKKPG